MQQGRYYQIHSPAELAQFALKGREPVIGPGLLLEHLSQNANMADFLRKNGVTWKVQGNSVIFFRGDVTERLDRADAVTVNGHRTRIDTGVDSVVQRSYSNLPRSIGHYEIISELGHGAMGRVYLAERDGAKVALKTIHEHASDTADAKQRFVREAMQGHRLDHKGIVKIYDAGNAGGVLYIAMEYLKGGDLRSLIDSGQLSGKWREIAKMGMDMAGALHYLHENGIVHRDMKPANVLLDEHGNPKISDLGLVSLVMDMERLTKSGEVLGTPIFMAPELFCDNKANARSDIYGLGLMLFQMASGYLPFQDAYGLHELMTRKLKSDIPRLKDVYPDVPDDLAEIIMKAAAKNPRKRYQDAGELKRDLHGYAVPRRRLLIEDTSMGRRKATGVIAAGLAVIGGALLLGMPEDEEAVNAVERRDKPKVKPVSSPPENLDQAVLSFNLKDNVGVYAQRVTEKGLNRVLRVSEERIPLAMAGNRLDHGIYVVVVDDSRYATVRIPIVLKDNSERTLDVALVDDVRVPLGMAPREFLYINEWKGMPVRDSKNRISHEDVGGIFMQATEVSIAEYMEFFRILGRAEREMYIPEVKVSGRKGMTTSWNIETGGLLADDLDLSLPVFGINYNAAQAYCSWLSDKLGEHVRMPTHSEFQLVAGNGDFQTDYPASREFDAELYFAGHKFGDLGGRLANYYRPVHSMEQGASMHGIKHLAGNVYEFIEGLSAGGNVSVRGGCSTKPYDCCRTYAAAMPLKPHMKHRSVGFRVVVEVDKQ